MIFLIENDTLLNESNGLEMCMHKKTNNDEH